MLLLETGLGFLIGLVLGLLGGGGSILTVPALVYLIGQPPQVAVTTSLMIVGANSLFGVCIRRTQNVLNWRVALLFGGVGMVMAYFAAGLSRLFPAPVLMMTFALLMLVVGGLMITRRPTTHTVQTESLNWRVALASGAGVGLLTGLLGVGGGFLIVPALVMLVGMPMEQAIGTSLVVIAMNSLAGLLGHLDTIGVDLSAVLVFVLGGFGGTLAGTTLSKKLTPSRLQTAFAVFVIGLAVVMLVDNVQRLI